MNISQKYQSIAEIALDLVNDIYRGISDLTAWDDVVNKLVEVTGSRKGHMTYRSDTSAQMMPSQSPLLAPRLVNISAEVLGQYLDYYYKIDPWTEHETNMKSQDVIRFSDYVPIEALKQSAFYTEWLNTLQVEDGFALNVANGPHTWVILNLLIDSTPKIEPDEIRQLLLLLAPHLQRAFQVAIELTLTNTTNLELSTLLDQHRESIVLLNKDGKLVYANATAEQLLDRCEALYISNNTLRCRSYAANKELIRLIDNAVNRVEDENCHMMLNRKSSSKPLQLYITPFYQCGDPSTIKRSYVIVLISDPKIHPDHLSSKLKELYKLTTTEARLVESLVQGNTLKGYAEINKISFNTARWHLRNVFNKTGVNNQSELIRLVMAMPGLFNQ
ncbi:MAG: LuxR C-terminal-related transcriptional regulator [Candidatus Thiodiazotropha sp.]